MARQNKPSFAKMKSKKRKGRASHEPLIVCGDVIYLDEFAIEQMKCIFG